LEGNPDTVAHDTEEPEHRDLCGHEPTSGTAGVPRRRRHGLRSSLPPVIGHRKRRHSTATQPLRRYRAATESP
jgi:hypothetical protein